MSTVMLLLSGEVDAGSLDRAVRGEAIPEDVERVVACRADDDPLATTAYGARWPYGAVVSLDAPARPVGELVASIAGIVDALDDVVDRAASTAVAGTTHRIIDGRTAVALVYAIHRVAGSTTEQYQDHWLHRHGPLARELVPTRGYEQLHANLVVSSQLNADLRLGDDVYDGVATCFFDTRAAFAAMLAARESSLDMNVIYEDELRFLDHGRSIGAMVRSTDGKPNIR